VASKVANPGMEIFYRKINAGNGIMPPRSVHPPMAVAALLTPLIFPFL
jgi:hypothetical protein